MKLLNTNSGGGGGGGGDGSLLTFLINNYCTVSSYLVDDLCREYTLSQLRFNPIRRNFISIPVLCFVPNGGFINTVSK